MLMYICVIMLRQFSLHFCLSYFYFYFTHFSRSHGLNIKRYFHVERLFPPSYPPGRAAVNSSQVFGLCSAAAWRALCFWIGVFVPDRELEIRLRHFCTCIPFTSHLISHYHSTPSLSLSVPHRHTREVLFASAGLQLLQDRLVVNLCGEINLPHHAESQKRLIAA